MMDIMGSLKETIEERNDHLVVVLAKFMGIFSHVQFLNFHGQPEARLDANQSVYESSEHRTRKSIILRIVDFLFFNMPSAYPVEINRIWVDGLVNMPRWRAFITTTTTKWANWTLCSTVMLAVDVSLLTVPGVDPTTTDFQPINVIAIYISVMCTLCSLCSLVWMSVIGISLRSSSDEVAEHITWLTSSPLGIDYMAIVYSVPFGLMWWGIILFFGSFISIIGSSTYMPTEVVALPAAYLAYFFATLAAWPEMFSLPKRAWMKMISIGQLVGRRERQQGVPSLASPVIRAEPSDQARGHYESSNFACMA